MSFVGIRKAYSKAKDFLTSVSSWHRRGECIANSPLASSFSLAGGRVGIQVSKCQWQWSSDHPHAQSSFLIYWVSCHYVYRFYIWTWTDRYMLCRVVTKIEGVIVRTIPWSMLVEFIPFNSSLLIAFHLFGNIFRSWPIRESTYLRSFFAKPGTLPFSLFASSTIITFIVCRNRNDVLHI